MHWSELQPALKNSHLFVKPKKKNVPHDGLWSCDVSWHYGCNPLSHSEHIFASLVFGLLTTMVT